MEKEDSGGFGGGGGKESMKRFSGVIGKGTNEINACAFQAALTVHVGSES